jgi:hypothetical protein
VLQYAKGGFMKKEIDLAKLHDVVNNSLAVINGLNEIKHKDEKIAKHIKIIADYINGLNDE